MNKNWVRTISWTEKREGHCDTEREAMERAEKNDETNEKNEEIHIVGGQKPDLTTTDYGNIGLDPSQWRLCYSPKIDRLRLPVKLTSADVYFIYNTQISYDWHPHRTLDLNRPPLTTDQGEIIGTYWWDTLDHETLSQEQARGEILSGLCHPTPSRMAREAQYRNIQDDWPINERSNMKNSECRMADVEAFVNGETEGTAKKQRRCDCCWELRKKDVPETTTHQTYCARMSKREHNT